MHDEDVIRLFQDYLQMKFAQQAAAPTKKLEPMKKKTKKKSGKAKPADQAKPADPSVKTEL